MSYLDKTIVELHELLLKKEVTPLSLAKEAIEKAKKDPNNAFETIVEKEALEFASSLQECEEDNLLWGIPFVCKDNISTKDILTTASSEVLKDYIPVYDAEVIRKLKDKKCVLIGKTTLDELAMGGTGTTGHKGITYNPYDPSKTYMIGGSSCGSCASVAASIVPFSLGSDTGDSIRKPASYGGLVGYKPTWGKISRYGLFPFAPSLDHVGFFARSIEDGAILLNALQGYDPKDGSSLKDHDEDNLKNLKNGVKGIKICVFKEIIDSINDKVILDVFNKSIDNLRSKGAIVDIISFPKELLNAIYPTYMVISCAEATSNNANLDGIKFGPRGEGNTYQEVMMNSRTKGFSELIKRRFVIGSYSLFKENQEELFLRAQKARHLIVNKVNEVFKKYDIIYSPCVSKARNPIKGGIDDKLSSTYLIAENHLAIGNFGGYPSLSLPIGTDDGFPFDANLTGRVFEDSLVFQVGYALEETLGYKNLSIEKVVK